MSEQPKLRILLVTRNMPPLVGGMERLNWHMAQELARYAEVRLVAPAGSAAWVPAQIRVREVPLKPLWRFLWSANLAAWREAKSFRPHLVMAGSGLTAPAALLAALSAGASSMAYVHGLDLVVRHRIYRALWLPAIRRVRRIVANSRATADLAISAGVAADRIGIVHPGVELPAADHDQHEVRQFRAGHDLAGRTLLLSVGRLSERKGLKEFVRHALPRIVTARPDVVLMIVGDVPANALSSRAQSPESILQEARRAGIESHVRFMGALGDDALRLVFRSADVHVFPVRELAGDPEGFGMVAMEAASYGVPTVAFACGGVIDAVADGRSGRLIAPGDYAAMADAVLETLSCTAALRDSCVEVAGQFAWHRFGERMLAEAARAIEGKVVS